jgi:hypothetical protein
MRAVKFLLIIAMSFQASAINNFTGSNCCESILSEQKIKNASLEQLGAEYVRLKKIQNAGCKDCNHFSKSGIQTILSQALVVLPNQDSLHVIKALGVPDETRNNESIYFWRGWHDYIYIKYSKGKVSSCNWFMAGE